MSPKLIDRVFDTKSPGEIFQQRHFDKEWHIFQEKPGHDTLMGVYTGIRFQSSGDANRLVFCISLSLQDL